MQKNKNNQSGHSLIETIIAGSIVGIVLITLLSVTTNQLTGAKAVTQLNAVTKVENSIASLLSSPTACARNFRNQSPLAVGEMDQLLNSEGDVVFSKGQSFDRKVILKEMHFARDGVERLRDNYIRTSLDVIIQHASEDSTTLNRIDTGSSEHLRSFHIYAELDVSDPTNIFIYNCLSREAGDANMWADGYTLSTPLVKTNQLNYLDGPVGVGTDDPQALFHVHNPSGQGNIHLTGLGDLNANHAVIYYMSSPENGINNVPVVASVKHIGNVNERALEFGYWKDPVSLHGGIVQVGRGDNAVTSASTMCVGNPAGGCKNIAGMIVMGRDDNYNYSQGQVIISGNGPNDYSSFGLLENQLDATTQTAWLFNHNRASGSVRMGKSRGGVHYPNLTVTETGQVGLNNINPQAQFDLRGPVGASGNGQGRIGLEGDEINFEPEAGQGSYIDFKRLGVVDFDARIWLRRLNGHFTFAGRNGFGNDSLILFNDAVTIGSVAGFGDTLNVDGIILAKSFQGVSDRSLKKDITPIGPVLERVKALRAVEFEWKAPYRRGKQIGFIAQEVENIFPEVVHTNKAGIKSVNYAALNVILIKAFQEQQALLVQLNEEIEHELSSLK